MSNNMQKNLMSRRSLFRTGAAAAAAAVAARLFGVPTPALAQDTGFGPARLLYLVPQAGGTWYVPAQVGCIDFCKMAGWTAKVATNNNYSVEYHLAALDAPIAAKAERIITGLDRHGL